jgi:hypothetical protein
MATCRTLPTAWNAYEISIATIPADNDVGVGRGKTVDSQETVDVESIAKKLTPEQREQMKRSLLLLDPAPALDTKGGGLDETKIRSEERVKTQGEEVEKSRTHARQGNCSRLRRVHQGSRQQKRAASWANSCASSPTIVCSATSR